MAARSATAREPIALRGRSGTRDALLDAVDDLLTERGWAACSLQAVARRAGLTTGAVYSTFGSRGALIAAAMLRRTDGVAGLPADEPDLVRAVTSYARTFHAMGNGPAGTNLVTAQLDLMRLCATDPAVSEAMRESFARLVEGLVADITSRAAGHPIAGPVDEAALRMIAVLQGLTLQRFAMRTDVGADAFVGAALAALGLESGA